MRASSESILPHGQAPSLECNDSDFDAGCDDFPVMNVHTTCSTTVPSPSPAVGLPSGGEFLNAILIAANLLVDSETTSVTQDDRLLCEELYAFLLLKGLSLTSASVLNP